MSHLLAEKTRVNHPWQDTVDALRQQLAATAIQRDESGGTAKTERDLIRASGLLGLSVAPEQGGLGASWQQTLVVVRDLANVDSSMAHLFAFHHLLLASTRLFGQASQWQPWHEKTMQNNWFWGNALNPLDKSTRAEPATDGSAYVFHGKKSFCSGASDSDMLLASAVDSSGRLLIAVLPTARKGIKVLHDWDNMGQRQTDSGSVEFDRVPVGYDELLIDPGPLSTPFACLRPLLAQLILANVYLGLGEGAFSQARDYTRQHARPWASSGVASAQHDPYVLSHFGDFWLGLQGARVLLDQAAAAFDQAWLMENRLTLAQRAQVAIAVAAAKVAATRASLDVAHRMFEVTGPRATTAALRLDRFWRNLRVHTLHDPLDYKLRELGDWALNERNPQPSFYS